MSSEAQIGFGATIERSSDGGVTFAKIPEAMAAAVPSVETDYVDVTNLDSVGGFREFIPGLKDAGEIEITANYTRAGYVQQLADQESAAMIKYRATFANGDQFEFDGYPTVKLDTAEVGDAQKMMVSIRISGKPIFTAGA